jgi:hypothetical protein
MLSLLCLWAKKCRQDMGKEFKSRRVLCRAESTICGGEGGEWSEHRDELSTRGSAPLLWKTSATLVPWMEVFPHHPPFASSKAASAVFLLRAGKSGMQSNCSPGGGGIWLDMLTT